MSSLHNYTTLFVRMRVAFFVFTVGTSAYHPHDWPETVEDVPLLAPEPIEDQIATLLASEERTQATGQRTKEAASGPASQSQDLLPRRAARQQGSKFWDWESHVSSMLELKGLRRDMCDPHFEDVLGLVTKDEDEDSSFLEESDEKIKEDIRSLLELRKKWTAWIAGGKDDEEKDDEEMWSAFIDDHKRVYDFFVGSSAVHKFAESELAKNKAQFDEHNQELNVCSSSEKSAWKTKKRADMHSHRGAGHAKGVLLEYLKTIARDHGEKVAYTKMKEGKNIFIKVKDIPVFDEFLEEKCTVVAEESVIKGKLDELKCNKRARARNLQEGFGPAKDAALAAQLATVAKKVNDLLKPGEQVPTLGNVLETFNDEELLMMLYDIGQLRVCPPDAISKPSHFQTMFRDFGFFNEHTRDLKYFSTPLWQIFVDGKDPQYGLGDSPAGLGVFLPPQRTSSVSQQVFLIYSTSTCLACWFSLSKEPAVKPMNIMPRDETLDGHVRLV